VLIKRPFALPQDCPVMEYGGCLNRFVSPRRSRESALKDAEFIQTLPRIWGLRVIRIEPDRLIEVADGSWKSPLR